MAAGQRLARLILLKVAEMMSIILTAAETSCPVLSIGVGYEAVVVD